MFEDLRPQIARDLRRHVRLVQQQLFDGEAAATQLVDRLRAFPKLKQPYHGMLAVLDWDHRLPTRTVTLRLHGYYTQAALTRAEKEYRLRCEAIAGRNLYPEFDVPDFTELPADESYEIDISPSGEVGEYRFTAPWRRDIPPHDSEEALAVVEASPEYLTVMNEAGTRPPYLGQAEAVAWAPPCETGHSAWTVDVWYLLSFEMGMGVGKSFLCDLQTRKVALVRDFTARLM